MQNQVVNRRTPPPRNLLDDPIQRHLQQKYWEMTMDSLRQFFEYVSILHPQCMEERLPPWEKSPSPIPPPLPLLPPPSPPIPSDNFSDSNASEAVSTPATVIDRLKPFDNFPYVPLSKENRPPIPVEFEDFRDAPPLPPRVVSPTQSRRSVPEILLPENVTRDIYVSTKTETSTKIISSENSPIGRQTETTTTTIRRERDEEVEQKIRPNLLPLGDNNRSSSALSSVDKEPKCKAVKGF